MEPKNFGLGGAGQSLNVFVEALHILFIRAVVDFGLRKLVGRALSSHQKASEN